MDVIEHRVEKFIGEEFLDGDTSALGRDVSLLETGVVDSLGLFRLVAFLEETFSILVDPEDLLVENFETIGAITTYVRGQLQARK
jgi:acyl carrier protein